jgi:hypothetical protein
LAVEIQQIPVLCAWLDLQSLSVLDVAVSSSSARKTWLLMLKSITCDAIDVWHHSLLSIRWLMFRDIRVTQILVNRKHRDKISDLTFEAIGINPSLTAYGITL